jgi:O-antigen/teichoic acid export membrane protein
MMIRRIMKTYFSEAGSKQRVRAQRKLLTDAITLIALGLSIFLLNSWDNLFVKASVGLFWGAFFLILKGPEAVKTFRSLARNNDNRRASYELTGQR